MTDKIDKPGVYFDLPEADYFAAEALGSTDFIKLYVDPASWWWDSPFNPQREERADNDGQRFGSAAHVCLLEGVDAYLDRFGVKPDIADHPEAMKTADELKAWLKDRGLKTTGAKAVLIDRVLAADPTAWIWDRIVEEALEDRPHVTERENARLLLMRRVIDAMPHLRDSLANGLSELSVFWTDETTGMLHRARFDRITPRRVWDLKTFVRRDGVSPRLGALRSAGNRNYHVQRAHYLEAAAQLATLIEQGCVHGGSADDRALLDVIAANEQDFSWLFYPSNGCPAPLNIPVKDGGLTAMEGEQRLADAKRAFCAWRDIYGLDHMWVSDAEEQPVDDDTEGFNFWRAA